MTYYKIVARVFYIAKREEKEMLKIGSLSIENIGPIAEIESRTISLKLPSIHNSKSHNTVECKVHQETSKGLKCGLFHIYHVSCRAITIDCN